MSKNNKYSEELNKLINKKVTNGTLISIVYINDDKLKENTDRVEIDLINLKLKTVYSHSQLIKPKITEYQISKINRMKLRSIVKKYNFAGWADLPMGDLLALDAPTKTITFHYDNSKNGGNHLDSYTINFYSRIPKDGYKLLNILSDYILSLKKRKKEIK